MRSTRSARHTPIRPIAPAMAVFALALTVGLLHAAPAEASTAGWDVRWVRSPAATGPMEGLSVDAGRVAYLTGSGTVVLEEGIRLPE